MGQVPSAPASGKSLPAVWEVIIEFLFAILSACTLLDRVFGLLKGMRWSCRCYRQSKGFIQTLLLSASLSSLISCQHGPRRKSVRPCAEVMEEPVIKRRKVVTTAVIPQTARTAPRPLPAPKPGSLRETEAARTVRPRPLHVNEKVDSSCASHADILLTGERKAH